MRRIIITGFALSFATAVLAQDTTTHKRTPPNVTLPRSNDHFMLQLGYLVWQGAPDSINKGGIPRSFNAYFMFDFPFKTNPHFSAAIGAGVATDNMYFDKTNVDIKDNTPTVVFDNVSDTTHFKKYKLATAYLEAPVELRFSSNPDDSRKSVKVALGAKVGVLVNAHVKGKTLQNKNNGTIVDYTLKENSKHFFNKNRLSVTGRIGYGHFSLFSSYALTPLFKEGVAAEIRPMTIGLTISGL
ncbi:MAG: PorT family protein [Chitinophagaceae bacterium]|nr:PorT family protein [Chitinophagaceae bacterium]